ncbi:unnamed protein product [Danaus chrysippus]|uniref:(African queen) hypothetical protein n=1 Tax=Danaus chrysippus TaxID=151541 RepID=A0A8J2QCF5_9NEOP|nr:unnamed protein product [Danaus chrysippus]
MHIIIIPALLYNRMMHALVKNGGFVDGLNMAKSKRERWMSPVADYHLSAISKTHKTPPLACSAPLIFANRDGHSTNLITPPAPAPAPASSSAPAPAPAPPSTSTLIDVDRCVNCVCKSPSHFHGHGGHIKELGRPPPARTLHNVTYY